MTTSVLRINSKHYKVKTDSDTEYRDVECAKYAWTCSCPDYNVASRACTHARLVQVSLGMRELAYPRRQTVVVETEESKECIYCHSDDVRKHSIRHNKSGDIQRYLCRSCNRKYSFSKQAHAYDAAVEAMELHFSGKTYTQITETLAKMEIEITSDTVSDWVHKYMNVMQSYIVKLTTGLTGDWDAKKKTWVVDETYIRSRKDMGFLYSLLDADTKAWIAQDIWIRQDAHSKTVSSFKAKNAREFANNQCTILYV